LTQRCRTKSHVSNVQTTMYWLCS